MVYWFYHLPVYQLENQEAFRQVGQKKVKENPKDRHRIRMPWFVVVHLILLHSNQLFMQIRFAFKPLHTHIGHLNSLKVFLVEAPIIQYLDEDLPS